MAGPLPLLRVRPKKTARKPAFGFELPLLEVFLPWLARALEEHS
jgi:hypothetical protein